MEDLENLDSSADPLAFLKAFTNARIGIGRSGTSITTIQSLKFKMAHAHARDAVYSSLDISDLTKNIQQFNLTVLNLQSKAADRAQYLQRPDLGRQLSTASEYELTHELHGFDVVICIADGLSALAIHEYAAALLKLLIPALLNYGFTIAPLCLVQQARVAIADDIAVGLKAKLALILIGERPGLSAADSMGAYLTFAPQRGLTDDKRNCVSNIRKGGLDLPLAVDKLVYLINEAFNKKMSGVLLKDNQGTYLK